MKLIVLAAGSGSRLKVSIESPPKPMQIFQENSLVEWSMVPWRALFREGLLSASDVVFAVLNQHINEFEIDTFLTNLFGNEIRVVPINRLENGPAMTLLEVYKQLESEQYFHPLEPVFVSDCDHFIAGSEMSNAIIKNINCKEFTQSSIMLFERPNSELNLQASFLKRDEHRKHRVYEKPDAVIQRVLNLESCLIGVYGFGSSKMLSNAISQLPFDTKEKEMYVSDLVNVSFDSFDVRLLTHYIESFYNLGDLNGQSEALEHLHGNRAIFESNTYFIDWDGVVCNHDSGPGFFKANYDKEPKLLELWNAVDVAKLNRSGARFVFVTARNENQRNVIESTISSIGFTNFELLMGVTSGVRFLINDTKPNHAAQPTSISINLERDAGGLKELLFRKSSFEPTFTLDSFQGESGALVSKVKHKDRIWIRKSIHKDESKLLEYQKAWFLTVGEFFPDLVPKVLASKFEPSGIGYLDVEFFDDFRTTESRFLDELTQEEIGSSLTQLYDTFNVESECDPLQEIGSIWELKVLPGYEKALGLLGENLESNYLSINYLGSPLENCIQSLRMISETITRAKKANSANGFKKTMQLTLIHGDLTLGNIGIAGDKIKFLDPIGSRIHPQFYYQGRLGRTFAEFDLVRLSLSVNCQYESWPTQIKLFNNQLVTDIRIQEDSVLELPIKLWPTKWNQIRESQVRLLFISTLARILPYKCHKKPNEAYFLLLLLNKFTQHFLDKDLDIC